MTSSNYAFTVISARQALLSKKRNIATGFTVDLVYKLENFES